MTAYGRRRRSCVFGTYLHKWLLLTIGETSLPSTILSPRSKTRGVGNGYSQLRVGAEAVMLFRALLSSTRWRVHAQRSIDEHLRSMTSVSPRLVSEEIDRHTFDALQKGSAALVVLGGHCDCVRGGGFVDVLHEEAKDAKDGIESSAGVARVARRAPGTQSQRAHMMKGDIHHLYYDC